MSKYYTPTIEEFHVGFEYEMDYGYNEWSYEFTPFDFGAISDFISENKCRVKYLDREDIESLGFKMIEPDEYVSDKRYLGLSTGDDKKLYIYHDSQSTTIWFRNNRGEENTLFDGVIKNKSELKKLLKQLHI